MKYKSNTITVEAFQIWAGQVAPAWFENSGLVRFFNPLDFTDIRCKTNNGWIRANKLDFLVFTGDQVIPMPPHEFHKQYVAIS